MSDRMDGRMDFGLPEEEAEEEGGENRFATAEATEATPFLVWFRRACVPPCPSLCWQRLAGRLAVPGPSELEPSLVLFFCFVLIFWAFGFSWLAGGRAMGDLVGRGEGKKDILLFYDFSSGVKFPSFSVCETH